jgi:two-component system nitrogen regulation response regulator GlnG
MDEVIRKAELVAETKSTVLITGETGTGKELVARAIHAHSARRAGPFMPICPAALSPTVIESELFGHVRGAFTGADRDRTGLLELAAGGTVLLDEIGDLPITLQVKLLRALEQRELTPVGGAESRATNFRILAATHRSLAAMIRRGEFREDLFYRLSVFQIELPPLRRRTDDIPLLAERFLSDLGPGYQSRRFTAATIRELQSRTWPGNVRELKNAVERAAIVARSDAIGPEHLPPEVPRKISARSMEERLTALLSRWANGQMKQQKLAKGEANLYDEFLGLAEPPLLRWALARCRQNRTAAAKLLGLNRATLRDKLRRHGMDDAAEP